MMLYMNRGHRLEYQCNLPAAAAILACDNGDDGDNGDNENDDNSDNDDDDEREKELLRTYILDIELFIEFIDVIDFFLLGAEIGMHRALSQCQKKSGDALFDALHIFDALVHILETIVWTKITKMQFWPQKHSLLDKVVSSRLEQLFGENAPIAFYFHCTFFWSGA